MSVIKVLRDLDGLFNYSTDENPTSQQDYQKAVKNWVKTIVSLVDSNLWQPETEYTVGSQLLTPSLPYYVLRCTVAGTSGAAEPDYTDVALGDEITDGTITWVVEKLATTAYVQGELTNYLPLSGGTLTGVVNGVTPPNGDNSKKLATTEFVNAKAGNYLPLSGGTPTGVVQAFAGSTTPQGWLLCDGSAVSRTDYAALYAVIGTTYGAGDGSKTFNLPNLTDKFIQGNSTSGTVKSAGLPNITGHFAMELVNPSESANGAFNLEKGSLHDRGFSGGGTLTWGDVYIDASRSSSVYGKSTTVQPPAVTMRYIIKY